MGQGRGREGRPPRIFRDTSFEQELCFSVSFMKTPRGAHAGPKMRRSTAEWLQPTLRVMAWPW